jgi:hypothetical protein
VNEDFVTYARAAAYLVSVGLIAVMDDLIRHARIHPAICRSG